jgi:hypothetical protein
MNATLLFVVFALVFPFFIPLILKVSLANPNATWFY